MQAMQCNIMWHRTCYAKIYSLWKFANARFWNFYPYCKSRIFRMHFIFEYFVRSGFRTKIECVLNLQSKAKNPQRLAAVWKFHAYERSEVTRIRKLSADEIFWICSMKFQPRVFTNLYDYGSQCIGMVTMIGYIFDIFGSERIGTMQNARASAIFQIHENTGTQSGGHRLAPVSTLTRCHCCNYYENGSIQLHESLSWLQNLLRHLPKFDHHLWMRCQVHKPYYCRFILDNSICCNIALQGNVNGTGNITQISRNRPQQPSKISQLAWLHQPVKFYSLAIFSEYHSKLLQDKGLHASESSSFTHACCTFRVMHQLVTQRKLTVQLWLEVRSSWTLTLFFQTSAVDSEPLSVPSS